MLGEREQNEASRTGRGESNVTKTGLMVAVVTLVTLGVVASTSQVTWSSHSSESFLIKQAVTKGRPQEKRISRQRTAEADAVIPANRVTCVYAGPNAARRFSAYGSVRIPSTQSVNGVRLTRVSGKWESWTHGRWVPHLRANWGIGNGVWLMGMTDSANRPIFPPPSTQGGVRVYAVVNGVPQFYTFDNRLNPRVNSFEMRFPERRVQANTQFRFWNLRILQNVPHLRAPAIITWHRGTVCFRVEFLTTGAVVPPSVNCRNIRDPIKCWETADCLMDTRGFCRKCRPQPNSDWCL